MSDTTNDEPRDDRRDEQPGEPREGMSRRAMLVAGAWSVPVITLAAASPAAAASGSFRWNFTFANGFQLNPTTTLVQTGFWLEDVVGAGGSVDQVTQTLTVPAPAVGDGPAATVSGGWSSPVTPSRIGSTDVYTTVWTGAVTPSTLPPDPSFTVPRTGLFGSSAQVAVSSTNATGTAGAVAWVATD